MRKPKNFNPIKNLKGCAHKKKTKLAPPKKVGVQSVAESMKESYKLKGI